MPSFSLRARPPAGDDRPAAILSGPDALDAHLEDEAHFPGGHALALATPASEAQVARLMRDSVSVLPIGAQSSLTGGATPRGETIISTARLKRIESIGPDWVRVEAGVTLAELDVALERAGRAYPPSPTFLGATIGGIVSTNAAGAATFKYGTTRDWVLALTVVLPDGDVLDIERGVTRLHADRFFELGLAGGNVRVEVPDYRMPLVPKLSAGYFAARGMDLIDLFIGSEGTLGVVTAATLRVLPERPAICLALVFFADPRAAMAFVRRLRDTARATWRNGDALGVDVSAVEYMDARSLALVREDRLDTVNGVRIPADATTALLVTLEMAAGTSARDAFDQIGRAQERDAPDAPLVRFVRMLTDAGALEDVELAVPGDDQRAAQLLAVREAVPAAVNARVGRAQRTIDPRITKTAADMVVPFERLEEFLALQATEFERLGLDAAVWGHISDGNVHPNVIPRSIADVESGKLAILECGRQALRLGGAPLAEHGVGRNPIKQELLRMMYGEAGLDQMRRVKRALDPSWKLAPGVLFSSPAGPRG